MDATELYSDAFDGDASSLLDEAIRQVEYHRDKLLYWRQLRRKLEGAIPKTPIEELLEIAEKQWQQ
jgi:hypothetical protein